MFARAKATTGERQMPKWRVPYERRADTTIPGPRNGVSAQVRRNDRFVGHESRRNEKKTRPAELAVLSDSYNNDNDDNNNNVNVNFCRRSERSPGPCQSTSGPPSPLGYYLFRPRYDILKRLIHYRRRAYSSKV